MTEESHEVEKVNFQPIHITAIISEEIGVPRNNGTPGSALYCVPFKLSHRPPSEWDRFFIQAWNHPSSWTSMHRPGIASVSSDRIILNGTTIEEVEKYHKRILELAVEEANRQYVEFQKQKRDLQQQEQERIREHKRKAEEAAKRVKFD